MSATESPRVAPSEITVTLRATGESHDYTEPETGAWLVGTCGRCRSELDDGAPIVKHSTYGWVHLACMAELIKVMAPDEAWMTLAEQIAASPSRYRAAEIRAVVQNVIRIARRGER